MFACNSVLFHMLCFQTGEVTAVFQ